MSIFDACFTYMKRNGGVHIVYIQCESAEEINRELRERDMPANYCGGYHLTPVVTFDSAHFTSMYAEIKEIKKKDVRREL